MPPLYDSFAPFRLPVDTASSVQQTVLSLARQIQTTPKSLAVAVGDSLPIAVLAQCFGPDHSIPYPTSTPSKVADLVSALVQTTGTVLPPDLPLAAPADLAAALHALAPIAAQAIQQSLHTMPLFRHSHADIEWLASLVVALHACTLVQRETNKAADTSTDQPVPPPVTATKRPKAVSRRPPAAKLRLNKKMAAQNRLTFSRSAPRAPTAEPAGPGPVAAEPADPVLVIIEPADPVPAATENVENPSPKTIVPVAQVPTPDSGVISVKQASTKPAPVKLAPIKRKSITSLPIAKKSKIV